MEDQTFHRFSIIILKLQSTLSIKVFFNENIHTHSRKNDIYSYILNAEGNFKNFCPTRQLKYESFGVPVINFQKKMNI